jgi:hypothetical protein
MAENAMQQEQIEFLDNEGRKELLSATQTGEDLYRLDGTPAFAYEVSCNDLVRVARGDDGQLRFVEVVEKSGNRTVRVLLNRFNLDSELGKAILAFIAELGCQHGNANANVLTITAPPAVDLQVIETRMVEYGVWWEYADPLWDHIHGND